MAELIQKQDTLNEGRVKINAAITDAEQAKVTAGEADSKATQALANSENTQTQLDTIVINGDSSVEAAQARVDEKGVGHTTLKDRIDDGFTKVTSQLNDTDEKLYMKGWHLDSKSRERKGMFVVASDDGRREEYDIAYPLLRDLGIAYCIGLNPKKIIDGHPDYCTLEELHEMKNDNRWKLEYLSHSYSHPNNPLLVDLNDEEAEFEFSESKKWIIENGLGTPSAWVYPGSNYGVRERKLARKYYRAARGGDEGSWEGINYPPFNQYELKSVFIDRSRRLGALLQQHNEETACQMMYQEMKDVIDKAADTKGALIFSTHFYMIDTPRIQQLFYDVMSYAKSKLESVTMNEMLDRMGNIIDVGDMSQNGTRAKGSNHYVVGADGVVSGSLTVVEDNRFNMNSRFWEFPHGVTLCNVYRQVDGDTPDGKSGVFINYRLNDNDPAFNWQYFIVFNSDAKFKRKYNGSFTQRTEWVSDTGALRDRNFDLSTPVEKFPPGASVYPVKSTSPSFELSPTGQPGHVVVFKADYDGNSLGYSSRLFFENNRIGRSYISTWSGGQWTEFIPLKTTHFPSEHDYSLKTPHRLLPMGTTYIIVTSGDPNAPEGKRGTCKIEKITQDSQRSYTIRTLEAIDSGDVYTSHALDSDNWSVWKVRRAESV